MTFGGVRGEIEGGRMKNSRLSRAPAPVVVEMFPMHLRNCVNEIDKKISTTPARDTTKCTVEGSLVAEESSQT